MSLAVAIIFYAACAIFLVGVLVRIHAYRKARSDFVIPMAPAPATYAGVVMRIVREAVFFESLIRADKWVWLFGWTFHVALAVVLMRHLFFFTDPVWSWVLWILPFGDYAAWGLIIALLGLWLRRLLIKKMRYISAPSDHLMLALLLLIALSGMLLRYHAHVDIFAVRNFALGLRVVELNDLPESLVLYVHLISVVMLIAIFPFSKLMHFIAPVFTPTHAQIDPPNRASRND